MHTVKISKYEAKWLELKKILQMQLYIYAIYILNYKMGTKILHWLNVITLDNVDTLIWKDDLYWKFYWLAERIRPSRNLMELGRCLNMNICSNWMEIYGNEIYIYINFIMYMRFIFYAEMVILCFLRKGLFLLLKTTFLCCHTIL